MWLPWSNWETGRLRTPSPSHKTPAPNRLQLPCSCPARRSFCSGGNQRPNHSLFHSSSHVTDLTYEILKTQKNKPCSSPSMSLEYTCLSPVAVISVTILTVTMHLSIYPVILTPSQLHSQATSSWLPISVINSLPARPCGWA